MNRFLVPTFFVAASTASLAFAQPCVARWEGHTLSGPGRTLFADFASAPTLYVGGDFEAPVPYLATFANGAFSPVAPGLDGPVLGLARHDDGTGSTLYVSGSINVPRPEGWTANYARLENGTFQFFGDDRGPDSWVGHIASFNFGAGPRLLATGGFGFRCSYVTQWTGSTWTCMGEGLTSVVTDSVVFDDGRGPALFCVGGFSIEGVTTRDGFGLARWDGTAFLPVGGGIDGVAYAITIFDHGQGPEVVVAGQLRNAGSVPATNIASWNGSHWRALGSGLDREVSALEPFDDGSGLKLVAAGNFTSAGGVQVQRLARWDGSAWSAVPAGGLPIGDVHDMLAFDPDGPGPLRTRLHLTGEFSAIGGVPARNFAVLIPAEPTADFNRDGFVDFFDYQAFVVAFETGAANADFNQDGFSDFFDYDAFAGAFETGC